MLHFWHIGTDSLRKTQVALEYAYRRADKNPTCSVFWVHADDETTFVSDYKTIAKKLKISTDLDDDELLMAVRDGIEALDSYVLVLDNADNLTAFGVRRAQSVGGENTAGKLARNLLGFVPWRSGTVLWTSRDKRISGSLVSAKRAINVASMTECEAMALLETVRDRKIGEEELDDATQLLAELDRLPLAVSQAAVYIRRMSTTPRNYLSKLAEHRKGQKVMLESEFDRHRRPGLSNSIFETWNISMEQIRLENSMAYDILHILAFMDSQNISFEMIIKAASFCSGKLTHKIPSDENTGRVISGSDSADYYDEVFRATIRLQEFSFLHSRVSEGTSRAYEMHKLVQEATQYSLRRKDRRKAEVHFSKQALHVVMDLFPERGRNFWEECEKYVSHAQRTGEWAELCEEEIKVSSLLTRVSNYFYDRGRWREKEPVDKRTYELRKRKLGEKHPDTIRSMADLAVTYHAQGRYKESEKIDVEVLALRRDVLGEKHPDTIESMASLAATYYAQGRYKESEKIKVEVLALRRDVLGEKHPNTIDSMANLAATYYAQGRYKESEKIEVEVLALWRDVLGEKHPNTIDSMANLAATYYAQGRYEESEKIKVEVLALRRDVLGEKHPNTIRSMASLAVTYCAQGRYEESEKIEVEVLALWRDVLGERHPDTLLAMHDLSITWNNRQRRPEALAMMQECFQLQCEVLGETHPSTQRSLRLLNSWVTDRRGKRSRLSRLFRRIAH